MTEPVVPGVAAVGSRVADPDDQLGIGLVVGMGAHGLDAVFTTLSGVEFHRTLPGDTAALADRVVARVAGDGYEAEVDVTEAVLASGIDVIRAVRDGASELPVSWATRSLLERSGWSGGGRVSVVAAVEGFYGLPLRAVTREDLLQVAAMPPSPAEPDIGPSPF